MSRNDEKRQVFEEWMKGDHVLLHIDGRNENVELPSHLKDNSAVTLKLSYNFQGETKHDNEAITSFLRFSGQYVECVVPWDAIWGITASNSENRVWPEDTPREVVLQMARHKLSEVGKKLFGKDKGKEKESSEEDTNSKQKRKNPHLKRIK